jgi:uncharacterized protein YyaL (SSP411 family)
MRSALLAKAPPGAFTLLQATRRLGASHAGLALRYAMAMPFPARSDREHLQATAQWLCKAQEAGGGSGVSAAFSLSAGWDVPYPETSGYIIATFIACADYFGDAAFVERARRIGDWEIAIQAPNGGVLSRPGRPETRVFNTGQVILGWLALFERIGDERYLAAARRAGDYLVALQEADGTWQRDTYCGARTYHARTDWALLRLARLSSGERYAETARRNLRWVIAQQRDNGWFTNCGFNEDDPITHVIDYTVIGVLESALLEPSALDADARARVAASADALCDVIERPGVAGIRGMLPASFDSRWRSRDRSSCLTGNAQIAYTLLRLHGVQPNARYAAAAATLIAALKETQALGRAPANVRGALPGSFPMHTGYLANAYPNWGAKFFADALLASLRQGQRFAIAA